MTESLLDRPKLRPSFMMASLGVLLSSVCFGVVPYFTRGLTDEGIANHAVVFYRYVVTSVVLLPILLREFRHWREMIWAMSSGALMGVGWTGYVTAIQTAPISTIGVLYMTYPIFTVLMAWLLFSEKPSSRAIAASAMILLAAFVAGNPAAVPSEQIPALLISLAAPVGFGFAICVLVYKLNNMSALAKIAAVCWGAVIALLPLFLATETDKIIPHDPSLWVYVVGLALVTALIPQLLFVVCSPVIGASKSAIFGSLELLTMFAVSVFLFGEELTTSQIIAGTIIIGAIAINRTRVTRNVTTNMTKE